MNDPQQIITFARAILHGDMEHRGWLMEAAQAYVAGRPLPKPRGGGDKEALIKALKEDNARLSGQIAEWSRANLEIVAKCSSVERQLAEFKRRSQAAENELERLGKAFTFVGRKRREG